MREISLCAAATLMMRRLLTTYGITMLRLKKNVDLQKASPRFAAYVVVVAFAWPETDDDGFVNT